MVIMTMMMMIICCWTCYWWWCTLLLYNCVYCWMYLHHHIIYHTYFYIHDSDGNDEKTLKVLKNNKIDTEIFTSRCPVCAKPAHLNNTLQETDFWIQCSNIRASCYDRCWILQSFIKNYINHTTKSCKMVMKVVVMMIIMIIMVMEVMMRLISILIVKESAIQQCGHEGFLINKPFSTNK